MTIVLRTAASIFALTAFAAAAPASAQSAGEPMDVQLDIEARCSVSATTMDFGAATFVTTGPLDTTSTIRVACNVPSIFRIDMDRGVNPAGAQRRMTNGMGGFVDYNIYRNAARTQDWGNGFFTGQWGFVIANTANEYTAYGRVPAFTAGSLTGTYLDTVTVTLNF